MQRVRALIYLWHAPQLQHFSLQVPEPLAVAGKAQKAYQLVNRGSCEVLGYLGSERTPRLLQPCTPTAFPITGNRIQWAPRYIYHGNVVRLSDSLYSCYCFPSLCPKMPLYWKCCECEISRTGEEDCDCGHERCSKCEITYLDYCCTPEFQVRDAIIHFSRGLKERLL